MPTEIRPTQVSRLQRSTSPSRDPSRIASSSSVVPTWLLEGILIAAWAIGAEKTFVYVRGEYAFPAAQLRRAVEEATAAGILGKDVFGTGFSHEVIVHVRCGRLHLRRGDGSPRIPRWGRRASPARSHPFPPSTVPSECPPPSTTSRPSATYPHVISKGVDWFRSIGTEKSPGTMIFGVSGHAVRPGLYELAPRYPPRRDRLRARRWSRKRVGASGV